MRALVPALILCVCVVLAVVQTAHLRETSQWTEVRRVMLTAELAVGELVADPASDLERFRSDRGGAEARIAERAGAGAVPGWQVRKQDGRNWLIIRDDATTVVVFDSLVSAVKERTGIELEVGGTAGVPVLQGRLIAGEAVRAQVPQVRGPGIPMAFGGIAMALCWLLLEGTLVLRGRARQRARDVLLQRVSHELRTPAAAVRALTEALASGAVEPGEEAQFFELLKSESTRLAVGVDRVLRAARGGGLTIRRETTDLGVWSADLNARWTPRIPGLTVSGGGSAEVDIARLTEAVDALLDNALKYGGPKVTLEVSPEQIAVSDDGAGIPEGDRKRVLKRLERVERGPGDPGGFGLGLWAVGEVARAHGGSLRLEGGSRFVLLLGS